MVAQLVERRTCNTQVAGATPARSSTLFPEKQNERH